MFLNVLMNLSLVCVPLFFYSCALTMSLMGLSVMLPQLFSRTIVSWPTQSTELTSHELYSRWLTGSEVYCGNGELLNPENASTYLPDSDNPNCVWYGHQRDADKNASYIEEISRTVRTVILDCPDISVKRKESVPRDKDNANSSFSRTLKYLRWVAAYNSHQSSLEKQRPVKIWLRSLHTNNNRMYFGDVYCTALAVGGNSIHPGTVKGILVNGHVITPQLNLEGSHDWETFSTLWKQRTRRFNLKIGLMLSPPSCSNLTDNNASLKSVLGKFDELYFYRGNWGGAYIREDEGSNALVSKKYKECKNLVAKLEPTAVEVKDALNEIHLLFRRFRGDDIDNYCLIYDSRI